MSRIKTIDSLYFLGFFGDSDYSYGYRVSGTFQRFGHGADAAETLANLKTVLNNSSELINNAVDVSLKTIIPTKNAVFSAVSVIRTTEVSFTIEDYTALSGAVVECDSNSGDGTFTEGVDFTAATSNEATATSLASAIDGTVGLSASAVDEVVTVTLNTATYIDKASSNGVGISVQSDLGKYWLLAALKTSLSEWSVIQKLGDASGTHLQEVYVLDTGVCELTSGKYVYGEYASGGSTGTPCRVISLDEDLSNPTTLVTFNAGSTSEHIDHIHSLRFDPWGRKTYMGTGDDGNEAAIIIIDDIIGVTWPSGENLRPDNLINQPGFSGFAGQQRYRTVDFLFTPEHVYIPSDQSTTDEKGIWRFPRDLSEYTRVFDGNSSDHNLWTGFVSSDKTMFFGSQKKDGGSNWIDVIASDGDNYENFNIIGRIQREASKSGVVAKMLGFYEAAGKVFCSVQDAAGINGLRTAVCEISGVFDPGYNEPDPILPAYFVGVGGVDQITQGGDQNDWQGLSPRRPWATVKYGLTNDVMAFGSLLKIDGQTFSETDIQPDFSTYSTGSYGGSENASGTPRVVIRGEGASSIIKNATDVDGPFKNVTDNHAIEFQDVVVANSGTSRSILWSEAAVNTTKWIIGRGAQIGRKADSTLNWAIYARADTIECMPGGKIAGPEGAGALGIICRSNNDIQISVHPGFVFDGFKNSIVYGFNGVQTGTYSLSVDGASFLNYGDGSTFPAIQLQAVVTQGNIPEIKNSVGIPKIGTPSILTDSSELTWSNSEFNYNYSPVNPNLIGTYNTNGLEYGASLGVDDSGKPIEGSILVAAGDPNRNASNDFDGLPYKNPPSIGAYSYVEVAIKRVYNTPNLIIPVIQELR